MLKRLVLILGLIAVSVVTCFSASPHTFLVVPPFARAAGIAGAYSSLSEGTYGLYYNPAGITSGMGFESQLSWVPWLQSAQFFQLAIINPYPVLTKGRIGALISWAQIPRPASGGQNFPVDWSAYPALVDALYNLHAVLGAGYEFLPEFSAGINFKLACEYTGDGIKEYNYGLDIGLRARFEMPGHRLRLGIIASNNGYELLSTVAGFEPPVKVTVGISDEFEFFSSSLLISADTAFSTNLNALFKIGFEYNLLEFLSLRAGYKIAAFNQPVFGAGVKFGGFELHYAFEPYEKLGLTHVVSVLYLWGTPPVNLKTDTGLISPNGDGILDKAVIAMDVGEVAKARKVKLIFTDSAGRKADEVFLPNKYAKYAEWNGKIKGKPAPDGKYSVELEAEYEVNGSSRSKPAIIRVDNTPPLLALGREANKNGAMDLPLMLNMSATDAAGISSWEIRFMDSKGGIFYSNKGAGPPPRFFEWDGTGPGGKRVENGGTYYYSLAATDAAGNSAKTETEEFLYMEAKKKIVMTFSSDTLFEKGKAAVKTSAYKALKQVKQEIRKYPGAEIVIFGHTDNKEPAGGYETRLKLSKARANAVKYYLENLLGVKKGLILSQGHGDLLPASAEDTEEGRARNRRVEVIIQTTVFR